MSTAGLRGAFSYVKGGIGWTGLTPRAVVAGAIEASGQVRVELRQSKVRTGRVGRAVIRNTGTKPVRVCAVRWVADIAALYPPPALRFAKALRPFYYATEIFRGDYFGTATTRGEHYFRPLPHEAVTIGFSEDIVFPGLFIGSGLEPRGLLCAAASCRRWVTSFRLYGGDGQNTWNFEVEQRPQGLDALTVGPGESVEVDGVFFDIVPTNDPQQATENYYTLLRRGGLFARRCDNPLPRQRIWISWNFGPMQHVTEAYVLKQLPVIRDKFPLVKFVQTDDGYERRYPSGQRAQIDLIYGGGEAYNEQFPGGPRRLVSEIKRHCLRPATWLGLWAAGTSPMIRDNPDWVLLDDMGRRIAYRSMFAADRGGPFDLCALDPSVPGVRRYLARVCKTVCRDWGFEGVKLDFYSFAFFIRRARYRHGNWTAPQYLQWLVDTFRTYLPRDGWLGLCSVAGTASPFLAQADYFRIAEDIGGGEWDLCKRIAQWTANTNMLLRERPVLPNIDSIGWGPAFSDAEWLSFLALCAVSGGALEIAGDLTQLDDGRIALMNRCLELSDPSRRVRCLDIPRGRVTDPPALWTAEGKKGVELAAVFNWADKARSVDCAALADVSPRWASAMRSAWPCEHAIRGGTVRLPAHGSVLLVRGR